MEIATDSYHFPSIEVIERHLAEHPATCALTNKTRQAIAQAFADKTLAGHRIHSTMLKVTLFGGIPMVDMPYSSGARARKALPVQEAGTVNCSEESEVDALHRKLFLALIACANQQVPQ